MTRCPCGSHATGYDNFGTHLRPGHDPPYYCFRFPWQFMMVSFAALWDRTETDPEDLPWRGYV